MQKERVIEEAAISPERSQSPPISHIGEKCVAIGNEILTTKAQKAGVFIIKHKSHFSCFKTTEKYIFLNHECTFFLERERESTQAGEGGRERKRERENPKQSPHPAWSPIQDSIPRPWDHDPKSRVRHSTD